MSKPIFARCLCRASSSRWTLPTSLLLFGVLLTVAIAPARAFPPDPIDPNTGEQNLIDLISSLPVNDIEPALDHFPLPYVIHAVGGGAAPTTIKQRAGSPARIDVDANRATGQGNSGDDFIVELNTEPYPTPHLVLNVERLGAQPLPEDVTILVAVPWNAFNDEALPDRPNLFFGFRTTGAFDEVERIYPLGGIGPQTVQIKFIPAVLGGTDHDFKIEVSTVGAVNPISFLAGHFDGTAETGIQNVLGLSTLADPVPAEITLGFDIGNTAPFQPPFQTGFAFSWEATDPAKVVFDYLENESFPIVDPDFRTSLTFEDMPTVEQLSFNLNAANATATIQHDANAEIGAVSLRHKRPDLLTVIGTATDVPTELDLTLNLSGSVDLNVNANTLDLQLQLIETSGFPGTAAFLGYDLDYVAVGMQNAPDLSAGFFAADRRYSVSATNPGECAGCDSIGMIEIVLDDDGRLDDQDAVIHCTGGTTECVDLPTSWDDSTHHSFSLVDDGQHGTAAARLLYVKQGSYILDAPSIAESYSLELSNAAPMQAYLRTTRDSNLIPQQDIEATCDLDVFPPGTIKFDIAFPDEIQYEMAEGLDSLHCFGHINDDNFDLLGADLPRFFGWDFEADEHLNVRAQDGADNPNSDTIGLFAVRLWNVADGLADSGDLLHVPLREVRARVDQIPSFESTWADNDVGTAIGFLAGSPHVGDLFLGGAQIALSTMVDLSPLGEVSVESPHYARFVDLGPSKQFGVGLFGINSYSYASNEGSGDRQLSTQYIADLDRTLILDIDTTFGGVFFPDYAIDATFTLDDVPQALALNTDLASRFNYTASDNVDLIVLDAVIDSDNDANANDVVNVRLTAGPLPSEVSFDLDAATEATLEMNGAAGSISLAMSSDKGIFGSGYKLIEAVVEDIPAQWKMKWWNRDLDAAELLVETNPGPLGQMSARISNHNSDAWNAMALDYIADSGPWLPGTISLSGSGCRISYTPFLQTVDLRYYTGTNAWHVLSRLDHLYCHSEALNLVPAVEDHVVRMKIEMLPPEETWAPGTEAKDQELSTVNYASLQFRGFQKLHVQADADEGTAALLLKVPVAGKHPLFVGLHSGKKKKSTTVQIENVPHELLAVLDLDRGISFLTSGSAGRVDVYKGVNWPMAGEKDKALRVTLDSLPSAVDITWNLPTETGDAASGGLSVSASDRFEFRLLKQNGKHRIVAATEFQNLQATWDIKVLNVEADVGWDKLYALFPAPGVSWGAVFLNYSRVSVAVDAPGGMDGILNMYDRIGDPENLEDPGPPPDDKGEWVPRLTLRFNDFTHADASVGISQCLGTPTPLGFVPCVGVAGGIGLDVDVNLGSMVFDFWDRGEGPEKITGRPDYIRSSPWHLSGGLLAFDPFETPLP